MAPANTVEFLSLVNAFIESGGWKPYLVGFLVIAAAFAAMRYMFNRD